MSSCFSQHYSSEVYITSDGWGWYGIVQAAAVNCIYLCMMMIDRYSRIHFISIYVSYMHVWYASQHHQHRHVSIPCTYMHAWRMYSLIMHAHFYMCRIDNACDMHACRYLYSRDAMSNPDQQVVDARRPLLSSSMAIAACTHPGNC